MEGAGSESSRPLIWMSRTMPVAWDSADRLTGLGYEVLTAPLLHVEFLPTVLDLKGVGSLIFTSRNGVAAFINRTSDRRLRVYAVGDATADAARRAGFQQVASAGGDVDDLCRMILAEARRDDGVVLRAGAHEPAGNLVADLAKSGFDVVDWTAYRTVDESPRDIVTQICAPQRPFDAVLIYSPKAARSLSRLLDNQRLPLGALICISQAAATELQAHDAYHICVAERPNEMSLFTALHAGRPQAIR